MFLIFLCYNTGMKDLEGNPVGSANADFCNFLRSDAVTAYAVGLWCADGYHRTSSIGLSNTNEDLIRKFTQFLLRHFSEDRLKLRLYYPDNDLRRTTAYHTYVNCRPLLREFKTIKENPNLFIPRELIWPYLAGRFDGDGSVAKDFHCDCRIVYSTEIEARNDLVFLELMDFKLSKIYQYKKTRTFCLYISRFETDKFLNGIYPYSVKLQKSAFVPRRDFSRKGRTVVI